MYSEKVSVIAFLIYPPAPCARQKQARHAAAGSVMESTSKRIVVDMSHWRKEGRRAWCVGMCFFFKLLLFSLSQGTGNSVPVDGAYSDCLEMPMVRNID